jgi:NitT/TauT family transport system permease protein
MPGKRDGLAVETKVVAEAGRAGYRRASALRGPRVPRLRIGVWLPPLLAFAIAVALWEWYARGHPHAIPSIGAIWHSLEEQPGLYWRDFRTTLQEITIGAGGGIVVAFLLAILMAELPVFERALMPLAVMLMVTPVIAIAPALVIAFGFGLFPKYLLTGIVVFFPMLVNTLAGLRIVDPRTLEVFTTLHASRWETFRYLRLPGSLPFVLAGLRICLPLSVVGATVAEFAAAGQQSGLGALIETAASEADLPVIWASIVILCALGIAFVALLAVIHKRVLWWDRDVVSPGKDRDSY